MPVVHLRIQRLLKTPSKDSEGLIGGVVKSAPRALYLTMVFLCRTSSLYCTIMAAPVFIAERCVARSAWRFLDAGLGDFTAPASASHAQSHLHSARSCICILHPELCLEHRIVM